MGEISLINGAVPVVVLVLEGSLAILLLGHRGRLWFQRLGKARLGVVILAWMLTLVIGVLWFVLVRE